MLKTQPLKTTKPIDHQQGRQHWITRYIRYLENQWTIAINSSTMQRHNHRTAQIHKPLYQIRIRSVLLFKLNIHEHSCQALLIHSKLMNPKSYLVKGCHRERHYLGLSVMANKLQCGCGTKTSRRWRTCRRVWGARWIIRLLPNNCWMTYEGLSAECHNRPTKVHVVVHSSFLLFAKCTI